MNLTLSILPGRYAICRLGAGEAVPDWAGPAPGAGRFVSITRTGDELSIVCAEAAVPDLIRCDRGWRVLAVEGPLDFSLTGVLAALTAPLAEARIAVFALSTFDTDYLLVKDDRLAQAVDALARAGGRIIDDPASRRRP